jgi:hypothetical protein
MFSLGITLVFQRGRTSSDSVEAIVVAIFWGAFMWVCIWRLGAIFRK